MRIVKGITVFLQYPSKNKRGKFVGENNLWYPLTEQLIQ